MKLFVDTSFWCALYDAGDENHSPASELWGVLQKLPVQLYITDYIFDETITITRRRVSHQGALRLGEVLINSQVVSMVRIDEDLFRDSWQLFKTHKDKSYSFTDCTSFTVMQALGINKTLAFDRHFSQMGFTVNKP